MRLPLAATVAALTLPGAALAHIELYSPTPRATAGIKAGPCGDANSVRGAVVTVLEPGATVTVQWKETVPHPGHYRISFDEDGQDFGVPASFADFYSDGLVLLDDITDKAGTGQYSVDVVLPAITCDNCTLQLIQVMTDKVPYGNGDDLYFACSDLTLAVAEPTTEPPTDTGGEPDTDEPPVVDDTDIDPVEGPDDVEPPATEEPKGCGVVGGASPVLAVVGLLALRRRWRRP